MHAWMQLRRDWLQEAGADASYVEGPRSIEELKEIGKRQKVQNLVPLWQYLLDFQTACPARVCQFMTLGTTG